MSDDKVKANGESKNCVQETTLLIEDIVRYLSRLSNVHKDPRIGNIELSKGLQQLANALKPHSQMPILQIGDAVSKAFSSNRRKGATQKPKATLPSDLKSLPDNKIDEILKDSNFTKKQLIELGNQRFGITQSKLMRLSKERVIESIRAALNHERSIGVISQEARRGGEKRSS